ncbi:MAG: hypothetical protein NVSMB44_22850 [Ktedonobacteraceae bacterium]
MKCLWRLGFPGYGVVANALFDVLPFTYLHNMLFFLQGESQYCSSHFARFFYHLLDLLD